MATTPTLFTAITIALLVAAVVAALIGVRLTVRTRRSARAAAAERAATDAAHNARAQADLAQAEARLAEAISRSEAASVRLHTAGARSAAATRHAAQRSAAATLEDTRHAIDEIGAGIGVAPAATAALGEHIVVPAELVAVRDPDGEGRSEALYLPDWAGAVWYGDDGLDTGRAATTAEEPAPVAYFVHHDPPERGELVFVVERDGPRTWYVPADNQWYDDHGRLHRAEHAADDEH